MNKKDAMLAAVEITKVAISSTNGDTLVRSDDVMAFIESVFKKVYELAGSKSDGSRVA